jgi:hypothetical protein
MRDKEIQSTISGVAREIVCTGDPWLLTNEGVVALQKRVDASLSGLFLIFTKIDDEEDRSFAFKALNELVMTLHEAIHYFHNIDLVATKQASRARLAKSKKNAPRYDRLFDCIRAESLAQRRVLSKGIKFAQLLRPGVRRRLGLSPDENGWPSASTIKGAVAKLKTPKER